ncbi:MAG: hypothetical protein IJC38_06065 [Erysipelotrichaceae bacterium]|nr:hypothetical protein [Erysipelotrichaceae bacterium]
MLNSELKQKEVIENDELEIDLREILIQLKRYWLFILVSVILSTGLLGVYSFVICDPLYESSAMIYLRSSGMSSASDVLQNLQIGNQIVEDYEIILKSRPVVEDVIHELDLDITVEDLNKEVSVTNPADTHILVITVRNTSPVMAMKIANAYLEYGMDRIREIEIKEPYVVEDAIVNPKKIAPSHLKNLVLGFLIGLAGSVGFSVAKIILNDKLNSTDMVERTLGYPILTTVPSDRTVEYSDSSSKKRKKRESQKGSVS